MTTATDLLSDAYREGNITPIGTAPTTAQLTEGLKMFNRYLNSAFGFMTGEALTDWQLPKVQRTGSVAANYPLLPGSQGQDSDPTFDPSYPPANARIVWDGTTQAAYFPETPNDGARMSFVMAKAATGTLTLYGNGRTIEGATTYASDGTVTSRTWMYRADTANWVALADLALTDDCPFPVEFDDLWICGVAIRMAPRYNKTVQEGTVTTYRRLLATLKARYRQPPPEPTGGSQLVMTDQTFGTGSEWMQ